MRCVAVNAINLLIILQVLVKSLSYAISRITTSHRTCKPHNSNLGHASLKKTGHLLTEEVLARDGEGTSQCVQVIPVLSEVPIGLGSSPELAIWKRFIQKHSDYAHFRCPEQPNIYN